MLKAVLFLMWRWSRWVMIVIATIAFALPVVTAATLGGLHLADVPVRDVLSTFTGAGLILIPLAFLTGITMGAVAWSADQQLGLVYLLTHPIPRWYHVLLRYTAGAIIACIPVLGLLLGCLVVTLFGSAPEFLHAYPVALTLRFAAATLVCYSVLFGTAGAFDKTYADDPAAMGKALAWLGGGVVVLLAMVYLDRTVLNGALDRGLTACGTGSWSPISLFVGRWGLFDV